MVNKYLKTNNFDTGDILFFNETQLFLLALILIFRVISIHVMGEKKRFFSRILTNYKVLKFYLITAKGN